MGLILFKHFEACFLSLRVFHRTFLSQWTSWALWHLVAAYLLISDFPWYIKVMPSWWPFRLSESTFHPLNTVQTKEHPKRSTQFKASFEVLYYFFKKRLSFLLWAQYNALCRSFGSNNSIRRPKKQLKYSYNPISWKQHPILYICSIFSWSFFYAF